MVALVRWWRTAADAAWRRRETRGARVPTAEAQVQQALRLVRDGELGRAMSMLHSLGVHEATPEVLTQLRERQLDRAHDVPGAPPDAAARAPRVTVAL
eukprot:4291039-Prymnesium_polylepis.1